MSRSASRTGQTQAREQNGSRHPPRPHSVAGGQSLPSNASRGEMLAVPQTPDVGTQSRTVGEIEHGGSRLSTRSRKPLPSFPESPRTEIYRESRADENLERNMDALKRYFMHQGCGLASGVIRPKRFPASLLCDRSVNGAAWSSSCKRTLPNRIECLMTRSPLGADTS